MLKLLGTVALGGVSYAVYRTLKKQPNLPDNDVEMYPFPGSGVLPMLEKAAEGLDWLEVVLNDPKRRENLLLEKKNDNS